MRRIFTAIVILSLLSGNLSAKSFSFLTGDSLTFASTLDTLALHPCAEIESTLVEQLGALKKKQLPGAAYRLFEWFADAPVMGREEVAVFLAREYFLGWEESAGNAAVTESDTAQGANVQQVKIDGRKKQGKLLNCTDEQRFAMRSFVLMNESSLVGMQAPELEMADTAGVKVALSQVKNEGEYTILFFYSTSCVKCRMASYKLADFVNGYNKGVLNVMAVCTDSNMDGWKEYVDSHFYIYNPFVNWRNVSDPEAETGYHLLYGVVETPKIFLLDRNGVIIGRNITVDNLQELLRKRNESKEQTDAFFKELFSRADSEEQVKALVDMLYQKICGSENSQAKSVNASGAQNRNSAGAQESGNLFTDLFYELYMFLKYSEDYDLQCGAAYLGQKYIVGMPQRWNNEAFVEKVAVAVELFGRNPLGAVVKPLDLVLEGDVSFSLDDLQAQWRVLYFYNPTCGLCAEVTPQMQEVCRKFINQELFVEFVAINTGSSRSEWMKYIVEQKRKDGATNSTEDATGISADDAVATSNAFWHNAMSADDAAANGTWHNAMSADEQARDAMFASYNLSAVPAIYLLDSCNRVVAKDISPQTLEGLLEYLRKRQ